MGTLLCARIAPAFREPSLAPLATRFVPSITRRLAAPVGRREALMAMAMAMVVMVMDMDMDMDQLMARGAPKTAFPGNAHPEHFHQGAGGAHPEAGAHPNAFAHQGALQPNLAHPQPAAFPGNAF